MKEITWTEAFFNPKGLKTIREENDLNIPDEYNKTVFKFLVVFGVMHLIIGIILGFVIGRIL